MTFPIQHWELGGKVKMCLLITLMQWKSDTFGSIQLRSVCFWGGALLLIFLWFFQLSYDPVIRPFGAVIISPIPHFLLGLGVRISYLKVTENNFTLLQVFVQKQHFFLGVSTRLAAPFMLIISVSDQPFWQLCRPVNLKRNINKVRETCAGCLCCTFLLWAYDDSS